MAYGPDVDKYDKTAVKDCFWRTKSVEESNQSDCDTFSLHLSLFAKIDAKSIHIKSI